MKLHVSLFVALSYLLNGTAAIHAKVKMADDVGQEPMENSFIVVFKEKDKDEKGTQSIFMPSVQDRVNNLRSANSNAKVTHIYDSVLQGFAANMTLEEAEAMADSDDVDFVEQNARRTAAVAWGLDRIDQRNLPLDNKFESPGNGSGVTAYIIDSGIRLSHDEFGGRASWGVNTIDNRNTDCDGHGTHVAGTVGGSVYGVAKKVNLVAVKVLDCNGDGTVASSIAGYDWIRSNAKKPAVANASIGGGKSNSENIAINRLHNSGVITVVAAGNDNGNACNESPASASDVITVAATAKNDQRAWFSNWGSCVDMFAPGVDIMSAINSGDSRYTTFDGTSMASPHVAGAAAVLLSTGMSAANVEKNLFDEATSGKVGNPRGSPNLLLYLDDSSSIGDDNPTNDDNSANDDNSTNDDYYDDGPVTVPCVDSRRKFLVNGRERNCWFAKNNRRNCNLTVVASMCPLTCNVCDQWRCSDGLGNMKYWGGKYHTCKWVARKNPSKRCSKWGIEKICRDTCGYCD